MKLISIIVLLNTCLFAQKINLPIVEDSLSNGFKILLYPNKQSPTIACRLFFTTGSVHEAPGRSGIAHMLEHMLFKGTKKVGITDSILDAKYIQQTDSIQKLLREARFSLDSLSLKKYQHVYDSLLTEHRKIMVKDELWETYLKHGGTGLNAFTSDLMTAYFVTLPKNKLELYLWLESDRMQNGILREFYPEREVVKEERRMRYDDSPTGRYFETLDAVFYEAHPYRIPTIGWASDIENLTREQAREHYQKYYKANNAILVLAGDFETETVLPLIKKYFAELPKGESHQRLKIKEPNQVAAKKITQIKKEAKPRVDLYFHTPEIGHPDLYPIDIIEGVLNGKSGRLYNRLVKQEGLATGASAGNYVRKYLSSFEISVQLKAGVSPAKVEKIIWEEIRKIQTDGVTPRELKKVKNQSYARTVRSFKNLDHVATQLAFYETYGDWRLLVEFPEKLSNVKLDEVKQVAEKYFRYSGSTTGRIVNSEEVLP
jgi:predicted Zn-dependent peptidase